MSAEAESSENERDRRVGEALDAYLEALQRGETIETGRWIARYPDLAEELSGCLEALELMRGAVSGQPDRSGAGTAKGAVGEGQGPPGRPPGALPRLHGYAVVEEIGRGGMGVVYKALQLATKRIVALKFLAEGMQASPNARRRFEREIELAAALDHPGIVRVLESGEEDGRAYCAMEFVDGMGLPAFIAGDSLGVTDKLTLFCQIAEAVQYAHHRAVIHRDLKPGNILVDASGRARILDFGLARFADEASVPNGAVSGMTRSGQLLGTLPYLSPEQAGGHGPDIDVRSDLYALGVILYEMLTGHPPYDTGGNLADVLHNICHAVPSRPSHFCHEIKSDLDAIVLKALEKPKDKRYQSAAAMAEDVRCYLRGEPVEANRTTRFYVLRKVYARHRRQVQLAAAAVMFLLVASVAILGLYVQVRRESHRLQEQLHVNRLRRAAAHLAAGHDKLAEDLMRRAYAENPDRRAYWSLLSYYTRNPLAAAVGSLGWITCVAYSPDGRYVVRGDLDGTLAVCDAKTHAALETIRAHDGGIRDAVFAADGALLITGGADGLLRFWRRDSWRPAGFRRAHPGGVAGLRCAKGCDRLLSVGSDGKVLLWDLSSAEVPVLIATHESNPANPAADLAPDGNSVALTASGTMVEIEEALSGRVRTVLSGFGRPIETVRFSSDGRRIAVWSFGEVSLWDVSNGTRLWSDDAGLSEPRPTSLWDFPPDAADAPDKPHVCWRPSLDFSSDGALLVLAGWGATVRIWDVQQGRRLGDLRAHGTAVYDVAFEPYSRRLAAGSIGELRVWDLAHYPGVLTWPQQRDVERTCVAIAGTSGTMAWGGASDGSVHVIDLASPGQVHQWKAHDRAIAALAFDREGRRLATSDRDGRLAIWNVDARRLLQSWQTGRTFVRALAFSPAGDRLASGSHAGRLDVWRCSDGSRVQTWRAHAGLILALAFSPTGDRLVTGGTDWYAKFWELGRPNAVGTWRHGEWVNAVAFSPDGHRVATGGADLRIRVGRPAERPDVWPQQAHAHWINAVAFLDGGRVLVSGGNDAALRFWDAQDGSDLATLPSPGGAVQTLAATEGGRWLAVGAAEAVQLIDVGAAAERVRRIGSPTGR